MSTVRPAMIIADERRVQKIPNNHVKGLALLGLGTAPAKPWRVGGFSGLVTLIKLCVGVDAI